MKYCMVIAEVETEIWVKMKPPLRMGYEKISYPYKILLKSLKPMVKLSSPLFLLIAIFTNSL